MEIIDQILNKITMYRLVLYGLGILIVIAWIESLFGLIKFPVTGFLLYLLFCILVSAATSWMLAKIFRAIPGQESWLITALILFLIVDYPRNSSEMIQVLGILILAQVGKYIFQWKKLHIFNPAAMATFVAGLFGSGMASWWIGSKNMLPAVVLVGFLIVRKVKKEKMVAMTLIIATIWMLIGKIPLQYAWMSGPLIFFTTVMLTEPITGANNGFLEVIMAIIVGFIYHIGPELSLLVGNLAIYLLAKKRAYVVELVKRENLGGEVWSFEFRANESVRFIPGQYMEWTISGVKLNSRGNRRYFTLANGSDCEVLRLVVRIPNVGSSDYKQRLLDYILGEKIKIAGASGDFVARWDHKMAWIAGGIGITPFASMASVYKGGEKKPILIYVNKGNDYPLAFEIEEKGVPVCRYNTDEHGYLDKNTIERMVPDYLERVFFVSGPGGMVAKYKKDLKEMGVTRVITDYFPGF